jgi:hypothetical protein
MPLKLKPHPQIWKAIKQKRMMRLVYHDKMRIIEPHDHGILNGSVQLLAWQVDGACSRPLPNWLLMKVDEMLDLTTLADTFPGGRRTGSGRRIKWDKLFIRVQPADDGGEAGAVREIKPRLAF